MRCKYTKFLYRANRCKIFFFDLTISLLTFLLENAKINQVLISLNDHFFIGNDIMRTAFMRYCCLSIAYRTHGNKSGLVIGLMREAYPIGS